MGYYLELQTQKNVAASRVDLVARLQKNKIPEHPEYENTYILYLESDVGILTIHGDEYFNKGELASIRISWGFDQAAWLPLIALAEKLGFRLYDPTTNEFITRDSYKNSYETQQRGFGLVENMIGKTTVSKKPLNKKKVIPLSILQTPIEDLCLRVRVDIALMKKLGLKKVGEILAYSEEDLKNQTNIGKNGLKNLKETLCEFGLKLKNDYA